MNFNPIKWFRRKVAPAVPAPVGTDPLAHMKSLIKKGIMIEEEFITTYLGIMKEQEFILLFGDRKEEAGKFLETLVNDSREHKRTLEEIVSKLN